MSGFALRYLTRDGCRLCEQALPLVIREAARRDITVVEVDVDSEPRLAAVYGHRVPVVLGPGDVVVAEGVVSPKTLRRRLREW